MPECVKGSGQAMILRETDSQGQQEPENPEYSGGASLSSSVS